jgi:hypothetical protein
MANLTWRQAGAQLGDYGFFYDVNGSGDAYLVYNVMGPGLGARACVQLLCKWINQSRSCLLCAMHARSTVVE